MTHAGYDVWLFDLDGTLVDIESWYPSAVIGRIGDELGVDFADREAAVLWYGMGGTRDETLADHDVSPERFWRTFHEVENPRERAQATYVYDDAAAFLDELDAPVGVVTHCQRYLTDPVLDELGMRDWLDAVVCCSDATGWKPDPEPVHRLMRQLDVDAEDGDGVLVGDDPADVGAARAAGLDAVQVVRPAGGRNGDHPDGGPGAGVGDPIADDDPIAGDADRVAAADGDRVAAGDGDRIAAADGGDPADEPLVIRDFSELS